MTNDTQVDWQCRFKSRSLSSQMAITRFFHECQTPTFCHHCCSPSSLITHHLLPLLLPPTFHLFHLIPLAPSSITQCPFPRCTPSTWTIAAQPITHYPPFPPHQSVVYSLLTFHFSSLLQFLTRNMYQRQGPAHQIFRFRFILPSHLQYSSPLYISYSLVTLSSPPLVMHL